MMKRLLIALFLLLLVTVSLPSDVYLWILKRPIEKQLRKIFDADSSKWDRKKLVIHNPKERLGTFEAKAIILKPTVRPLSLRVDVEMQVVEPKLELSEKTTTFLSSLGLLAQSNQWLLSILQIQTLVKMEKGVCGEYDFSLVGTISKRRSDGVAAFSSENGAIQLSFTVGSSRRYEVRSLHRNTKLASFFSPSKAVDLSGQYDGYLQFNEEGAVRAVGVVKELHVDVPKYDLLVKAPLMNVEFPGFYGREILASWKKEPYQLKLSQLAGTLQGWDECEVCLYGGELFDPEGILKMKNFQAELLVKQGALQDFFLRGVYLGSDFRLSRHHNRVDLKIFDLDIANRKLNIDSHFLEGSDVLVMTMDEITQGKKRREWRIDASPNDESSFLGHLPVPLHPVFECEGRAPCNSFSLKGTGNGYSFYAPKVSLNGETLFADTLSLLLGDRFDLSALVLKKDGSFTLGSLLGKDLKTNNGWLPQQITLHDLKMEQMDGILGQPKTYRGMGRIAFTSEPLFTAPKEFGVDELLINPSRGKVEFTLENQKIILRNLRDVYAKGKMSKFSLADQKVSWIDDRGNLELYLKIKPYNVLFMVADLFSISMKGTWDEPVIFVQKN